MTMNETDQRPARATIMVVDDTPANLALLDTMLRNQGYRVAAFPRGDLALNAAADNPPDLILLDIVMPGLNGFEVCGRLKADETLRDIPVLFITALNNIEDKLRAFAAGGADYITKPFQADEMAARVKTHLKLRALQQELEGQNLNLESLVAQRTGELEQAFAQLSRLDRVKSDFLTMISHEMRTPLNGVLSISEFVFDLAPDTGECRELRSFYQQSRRRIERLLDDANTLNSLDTPHKQEQPSPIPVLEVFVEAKQAAAGITVLTDFPPGFEAVCALGDRVLLIRAFETLIQVASCFASATNLAALSATVTEKQVVLNFSLDNLRLADDQAAQFFEISSPARSASFAESLGLAPVVAHRIIALFGGDVRFVKKGAATGMLRVEMARPV
ncbi:MAG: response regulator [bacterium]